MTLHDRARAYLDRFPPAVDYVPPTLAEIQESRPVDGDAEGRSPRIPLHEITDTEIAGVPVRIFRPAPGDLPVVVYVHGGGFVFGSADVDDPMCRDLAVRAGALVVSIDYRLAPEHPFPAAVDDCWAVVERVLRDHETVAIMGESAGANLATVCAALARDAGLTLTHQLLVYPCTEMRTDTKGFAEEGHHNLETARVTWLFDQYAGAADRTDPRFAPALLEDKTGLAPATVITAEHDPLTAECERYAADLGAAYRCFPGTLHGFFGLPGFFPEAAEARAYAADRLTASF
ncbi:alpha/beta hydrolase [Herbidospora galbida]|uniref:Alpha/beta hydrolase n=1 Tax=Herbidospora galbida TaxID=2575442 RepID=A0A4V6XB29_9ACTN|nr:alpha/beta hydrolase [Herbidospora galbida]TKK75853.1 alpha/beta hydrolase [Herbidospora galbida]